MAPTGPSPTDASSLGPRAILTTARNGQVLVMRLAGELDMEGAGVFEEAPTENASALVLDLSRLDFCDSTGLNALLRLRLDAQGRGVPVHLAALTDRVARLLEITGADRIFPVHPSVENALAALERD
ncbi:STAS domain-containing protein [Streptomyces silvisoli]|uniref:Anti-sigma factor antagonist n=1 Tax=Streptomyces silvisoli TaxID=3034235 RepID=A0ABT5ZUW2_9ACTN|nr:STAS domain-containing protein [Streptomyces silvisoli]MDF3293531.1 STAS domain-containing protein [Streptomyces silvisoli]